MPECGAVTVGREREREGDCLLLGMIDKYEEGKLKWDKSGELFITLRQIGLI